MLVESVDTRAIPWRRGDRLNTRRRTWILGDIETGPDCVALCLAPDHHGSPLTLLSPFDRFTPARLSHQQPLVALRAFARHLFHALAVSHPAGSLRWTTHATINLHAYQLEPALAIFRHGHTRVLIGDDVGLGKTVEAGVILRELVGNRRATRALVLVPAGLRDQWRHELARLFAVEATVADAAWLAALAEEMPPDGNPWNLPGVFVTSQDLIKRPEQLRPLEDVTWDLLIVDEAHGCGVGSDRRAAVHAVACRARRVVLLTATPPDSPADFTALCDIGRVSSEPPIAFFRRTRADVGRSSPRSSRLMFVRPTEAELRMHELLGNYAGLVWRESRLRGDDLAQLAVVTLRKRALSSARSLAVSAARRLTILSGNERSTEWQPRLPIDPDEYDTKDDEPGEVVGAPGLSDAPRERRWLSAIIEAAQRAARHESKIAWLCRFLRRVAEPAIVFTEYRDTLQRLQATLERERHVLVLHGGLAAAERAHIQRRFNESPSLLLATDAASEGLNLHHRCRLVIHYELPWSTVRLEQRAGRVDRLGQPRQVHELALLSRTTAELVVLAPLMQRVAKQAKRPGSGGLATVLSESQVAALVFGDVAPSPNPSPAVQVEPLSLREEAEREVQRLNNARCLAAAGEVDLGPNVPVARARLRRGVLPPAVVALYQLSLIDRLGSTWHSEVLALKLRAGRRKALTKVQLQQVVSELTQRRDPRLRAVLSRLLMPPLIEATEVYRACAAALTLRDDGLDAIRASAASRLVQASLFTMRRSQRELRPGAEPGPMPRLQSPTVPVLSVDVRLIGVLDVRRG